MPRIAALVERARTPAGRKMARYSLVSVISVIVSQAVLGICFGVFHWSARASNIWAVCVSAVPSYVLNRAWVWGKRGRSHLMKEVVPFWAIAFLGLILSTIAADFAEDRADRITDSHLGVTLIVMAASIGAFGILWVGKFILFNKVLFAHPGSNVEEPSPATGSG